MYLHGWTENLDVPVTSHHGSGGLGWNPALVLCGGSSPVVWRVFGVVDSTLAVWTLQRWLMHQTLVPCVKFCG